MTHEKINYFVVLPLLSLFSLTHPLDDECVVTPTDAQHDLVTFVVNHLGGSVDLEYWYNETQTAVDARASSDIRYRIKSKCREKIRLKKEHA
jgi:hypothetical protein